MKSSYKKDKQEHPHDALQVPTTPESFHPGTLGKLLLYVDSQFARWFDKPYQSLRAKKLLCSASQNAAHSTEASGEATN